MIDNYDSFTWNLVQYCAELGADMTVRRNDELSAAEAIRSAPDAIVLSPGPGRPEKAGICVALIRAADGTIPLLGVCLGHQAIALAFGGVIDYAPTLMHGKVSQVSHPDSTLFRDVPSPFTATRYHSLMVRTEGMPPEFQVTATAEDGVVMAIENDTRALYGVQFHPESIMTPDGKTILRNFMRAAEAFGARAGKGRAL